MKKQVTYFLATCLFLLSASISKAQTGSLEAIVLSKKGNIVELEPVSFTGEDFQTGTVADMSKHFEEKLGNMTMQGWLGVAKVKFIPTSRQNIEIEILEEKSDIVVNEEKVDHFKPGKRMKLEWPAKPDPDPKTATPQSGN